MIIDQKVTIKPRNNNKKYYRDLGYEFKDNESVEVKLSDVPKKGNVLIKIKCDFCGDIAEKEIGNVYKNKKHYCSRQCDSKDKAKMAKEKFELLLGGIDAKDYLYQEYVVERKSTREIAKNVYGSDKRYTSILRWIKTLGLKEELRHGSEAIKTQWINNPKRKKEQGELIKKHLGAGTPSRMKLIKKMNTIEYKEKSRVAKLGKNNPMYGVTGENHPHWNPSLTDEERLLKRKVPQNYKWIRDVYERDNYTCQCCGYDNGGTLIAHHLNSWHWDKDNRFNIENGVTLCESCHHIFHKEYGYKDNTKEQFLEYLNKALVK